MRDQDEISKVDVPYRCDIGFTYFCLIMPYSLLLQRTWDGRKQQCFILHGWEKIACGVNFYENVGGCACSTYILENAIPT